MLALRGRTLFDVRRLALRIQSVGDKANRLQSGHAFRASSISTTSRSFSSTADAAVSTDLSVSSEAAPVQSPSSQSTEPNAPRSYPLAVEPLRSVPKAARTLDVRQMPTPEEMDALEQTIKPHQNVKAFKLIAYFRVTRQLDRLLDFFERLPSLEIVPDAYVWNDIVAACVREKRYDLTKLYWNAMIESGVLPSNYLYVVTISTLLGHGQRDSADQLLREAEGIGLRLSTQLYAFFCESLLRGGRHDELRELYARMRTLGVHIDASVTIALVRSAYANRNIDELRRFYADLLAAGARPTSELMAQVVDAEYRHGSADEAWRVVESHPQHSLVPTVSLLRRVMHEEERRGQNALVPRVLALAQQFDLDTSDMYSTLFDALAHVDVVDVGERVMSDLLVKRPERIDVGVVASYCRMLSARARAAMTPVIKFDAMRAQARELGSALQLRIDAAANTSAVRHMTCVCVCVCVRV
jgi:pentatricopeptide repeat protein